MLVSSPAMDAKMQYHRAYQICRSAFDGAPPHRDGRPAHEHSDRVAIRCMSVYRGHFKMAAVAYLHDVVEDTHYTMDTLRNNGFSEDMLEAVEALTRGKEESYNAYIRRVLQNPLAVKVKIIDIEDNLARLDTEKNRDMYEKTLVTLKASLSV